MGCQKAKWMFYAYIFSQNVPESSSITTEKKNIILKAYFTQKVGSGGNFECGNQVNSRRQIQTFFFFFFFFFLNTITYNYLQILTITYITKQKEKKKNIYIYSTLLQQ